MNHRTLWRGIMVVSLTLLASIGVTQSFAQPPTADIQADYRGESYPIPGRYIVVFKSRVADPAAEARNLMRGHRGQIHHTYSYAIKGFSATLPEAAYNAILKNPNVDYVEQDATVYAWETTTQTGATWGIDRIDQTDLPLNQSYTYEQNGAGVLAYIIDTGIRASHVEFTGRIAPGFTAILDGRGTADCNGHGTHVAGTVGGTRYGVAKGVTLVPVRVLNCQGSGTWSGVIAGIDWVTGTEVEGGE
jgi:aqualysin 1